MAIQRSVPPKRFLVEPLSYQQTAQLAVAPATALMVLGLGLPVLIKFSLDHQNAVVTLVQGGETLSRHLGWIIPMIIAALLGFLAAALTSNSYADAVESDRLRRVLGGTGLLLGTAGILVAVYVGIYAATSQDWALFMGLIPAIVIICFLALFIGRYVALSGDEQLSGLDTDMCRRKERMSTLRERSSQSWWLAIFPSSVVIALAAAVVAMSLRPEHSLRSFVVVLILGFLACLFILLFGWFVLVTTFTDMSKTRFMTWFPALTLYILIGGIIVSVMFSSKGSWAGLGSLVVGCGCLFAMIVPRKRQSQWLLNSSVNGLAAASAHKRLAAQQKRDSIRRDDLLDSFAEDAPASWLKQKLARLGSLAHTRSEAAVPSRTSGTKNSITRKNGLR